jgi:hypothetical protein
MWTKRLLRLHIKRAPLSVRAKNPQHCGHLSGLLKIHHELFPYPMDIFPDENATKLMKHSNIFACVVEASALIRRNECPFQKVLLMGGTLAP